MNSGRGNNFSGGGGDSRQLFAQVQTALALQNWQQQQQQQQGNMNTNSFFQGQQQQRQQQQIAIPSSGNHINFSDRIGALPSLQANINESLLLLGGRPSSSQFDMVSWSGGSDLSSRRNNLLQDIGSGTQKHFQSSWERNKKKMSGLKRGESISSLLSPSQQQRHQKRHKKLSGGGGVTGNGNCNPFLLGRGASYNHMNNIISTKGVMEAQTMPLPSQREEGKRRRITCPRDLAMYRKAWEVLMIRSRNHSSGPSPKENLSVVTELFSRAIQFGKIPLYDDEDQFEKVNPAYANRASLASV